MILGNIGSRKSLNFKIGHRSQQITKLGLEISSPEIKNVYDILYL